MSVYQGRTRRQRALVWTAAVGVAAGATVIAVGLRGPRPPQGHPGGVYTREGMGGYVPASTLRRTHGPLTPILQLDADYVAGHYAQVERQAEPLLAQQGDPSPKQRREAARAGLLWAYSAARQRHFETAAERFTVTRHIAASLPDHGAAPAHYGDPEPGIEEEAAFQHAVCVGALGHPSAAEGEYVAFMQSYPQSILIHAAVKRIGRYHHGDIPKAAEAVWRQAMDLQHAREAAQQRERSLCGPECLAEALRRRGKPVEVHALAKEMKTDEHGTSLLALAQTAQRHGLPARGLELTQAGLAQQKLPAVAYLNTGHYVLVDRVQPAAVRVWDPDAKGSGKPAQVSMPLAQWRQAWSGIVLGW